MLFFRCASSSSTFSSLVTIYDSDVAVDFHERSTLHLSCRKLQKLVSLARKTIFFLRVILRCRTLRLPAHRQAVQFFLDIFFCWRFLEEDFILNLSTFSTWQKICAGSCNCVFQITKISSYESSSD